jgi:uncharacterized protein with HEPN domain
VNDRDRTYLGHIQDCIAAIREFSAIGKEAFVKSRLHRDAVMRNFEIIGEASTRISKETKDRGNIPWAEIKALRNLLIHQYTDIRPDLIWQVIVDDLPALEAHVLDLLSK